MALPALTKTWQYALNNSWGTSGSALIDHQIVMRSIKNALKAFATNAWTVRGSSNGSTAGMDTTDRWSANGDLVWAASGAAHSWIVLRQAAIAGAAEVCIDLTPLENGVQGPRATIVWSASAGFTGGSVTNRPTATDEMVLLNGVSWMGTTSASSSFTARGHMRMSSDGQATRVLVHVANVPVSLWLFDKAQNPATGWSNPSVALALGATSGSDSVLTYAKLWAAANARARVGAITASVYFATLGHGGLGTGQRITSAGSVSGEWPMMPIACVSETASAVELLTGRTEGQRGLFDVWYGSTGLGNPSDYYPSGGSKTFVQHGCWILPNDGTTIATT
jgi:hypothetical protein